MNYIRRSALAVFLVLPVAVSGCIPVHHSVSYHGSYHYSSSHCSIAPHGIPVQKHPGPTMVRSGARHGYR